ncbi:iron ABC transporter permease [Anaerolentibacter hominis]|uniref:FecCD family ABC transporter permease n=1 Tax=Anaerolentibacter hominis TaxID=3079009 RepID=UPI0031B8B206
MIKKDPEGKALLTHKHRLARIGICCLILMIGLFLSIAMGAVEYSLPEIFHDLFRESEGVNHIILANVRLPRTLVGGLAGMCLGLSGAVMQGITRNPMASPSILGVTNGAALVTLLLFVYFPSAHYLTPAASILGAFVTTMLVYFLAWKNGVAPVRFILSGVAVSSILNAFYSVVSVLHPDAIQGMIGFSVGSLNARTWNHFMLILPYALAGLILVMCLTNRLNLLSMGDEVATGLGLNVERTRLLFIVISSLLAGSAISVVGQIAFVGLCVPHITRMLVGSDYRYLLPASAINGASLIICCDWLARIVIRPEEMNVGIMIAALGAPFFLYLLRRKGGYQM